ncbi:hypothetical protein [Alkalibacillus haloalkaliphilus]|uniref:Uncharacterized protein n=1 Tax=Alkalibacillus haloalkaliphilus TaxID=94136 RepID=A0A511W7I7_9BACI|nr:hypothetical protein [Alkalibacillus haloalkaliphilus]GEN47060.1 hypothetical protein AHA02nite_28360 [Alkalibacillus haloalkaliphilus]
MSIMVTLPHPRFFGNFDKYAGEIVIHGTGSFRNQLIATPEDPPTWSSRIELPTAASVTLNSRVLVRPFNSLTGTSAAPVLEGKILVGKCQ